jgi:hypothetical protein
VRASTAGSTRVSFIYDIQQTDPRERVAGADILSQLGWQDRTFLEESVRDARDRYDAIEKKNQKGDEGDFYCVLVFRNTDQLSKFLQAAKLPDNRYLPLQPQK